jgi:hypothetical protein
MVRFRTPTMVMQVISVIEQTFSAANPNATAHQTLFLTPFECCDVCRKWRDEYVEREIVDASQPREYEETGPLRLCHRPVE